MKAKEQLSIRLQMAEMHEEYISRMSQAYDNHFYVETVWYCYSIFEQRISRLISKVIDKCEVAPDRTDEKSASISTRIICLKKLIDSNYGAFSTINISILDRISKWCEDRNELVHGLVSLSHYKQFDQEFETLAKTGVSLAFELYDACTDFREQWYAIEDPKDPFPVQKCRCKNMKCINPNII